jgi:hypothetical protein
MGQIGIVIGHQPDSLFHLQDDDQKPKPTTFFRLNEQLTQEQ